MNYFSPLTPLNPEFLKNLDMYFADDAQGFLKELPALIKRYEILWNIKVLKPFPNLSINFVAPAVGKNGEHYVFKCGVPNPEFNSEIDALQFIDGHGLPKVLQASKEDAVLLQERIFPGVSLRETLRETLGETLRNGDVSDAKATEVAAVAMKDLFVAASKPIPETYSFPHITDWLGAFNRPSYLDRRTMFPKKLLEYSEALLSDLLASQKTAILLHGDLHHENIVSHTRDANHGSRNISGNSWMVIDPKGIMGEASYEVGAFLRNPHELSTNTDLKSTMAKRIDIFSEVLELDRDRIIAWSIVQTVLSVWWSIEDNPQAKSVNDLDDASKTTLACGLAMCELM